MTEVNQSALPFVVCLCPTYRRPARLIENAVACFEAQTYPKDRRTLLVLDDADDLRNGSENGWCVASSRKRFDSLPAKYNELLRWADLRRSMREKDRECIIVVWEDDDIYLPWHIENHVKTLADHNWSHPSNVWSTYTGKLAQEGAAGRFHAALAFRRDFLESIGGWPDTKRGDFDQQIIARARQVEPPADPCDFGPPGYVFRWGSTQAVHGQALMRSPDDETWYDRAAQEISHQPLGRVLVPRFDEETRRVYNELGIKSGSLEKGV